MLLLLLLLLLVADAALGDQSSFRVPMA